MEFLRSVGGGIRDAAGAFDAPNPPGQPGILGLIAQQPEHILRGLIQAPGAAIDYGLARFAEPGTANTYRNVQSAGALSELMAGRPGALQIPQVRQLTGLPEGFTVPETGMFTPQEQYQIEQAEQLRRRSEMIQQYLGGGGAGKLGRRRTVKINPITGNIQLEYSDEPYVRPEGQGVNPPRVRIEGSTDQPPPPPPPPGDQGTGHRTLRPTPDEPARNLRTPPRLLSLPPGQTVHIPQPDGTTLEGMVDRDGISITTPRGGKYTFDPDSQTAVPTPGEPQAGAPPPSTTTTTLPPSTTTPSTTRPPVTTTTTPPSTTTTTVPTRGGTQPTLPPNFTRDDVLKLPYTGPGGQGTAATPPGGTPTPPATPTGPGGPPAASTTPQDRALDDDERILGIPPSEPDVGYPSPAPAPPTGARAGATLGGALATPGAPGLGPTAVVPSAPGRALARVAGTARALLSPSEAQAQETETAGGPPGEVKSTLLPSSKQIADFGDAVQHYRPLREYIAKHPELRTSQDILFDTKTQGMVADWVSFREIETAKVKKAGEIGAAERRVLSAIRGVLDRLDRFDRPEEEFGGKAPVDYLPNNPTRIGLGNIARQVPGVGGLLNEFISPGRTGFPGEVGQRILPGADITRLAPTPEGRAMQTLQTLGKGFLAQLARGSSEVGNLNTFEQINMRDAFIPNPETDTPTSARQKLAEGRAMFRGFERALRTGQMTGEQVMRMFERGIEADYDELTRRGQEPGQGRGVAVEGPIGSGVAR
jgi:hypothetical protein